MALGELHIIYEVSGSQTKPYLSRSCEQVKHSKVAEEKPEFSKAHIIMTKKIVIDKSFLPHKPGSQFNPNKEWILWIPDTLIRELALSSRNDIFYLLENTCPFGKRAWN